MKHKEPRSILTQILTGRELSHIAMIFLVAVLAGGLIYATSPTLADLFHNIFHADSGGNGVSCVDEVDRVVTAREKFRVGNSYFGGSRGYDLRCARYGYNQAILIDPKAYFMLWHQFGRTDFLLGKYEDALYKFDRQLEYFGDSYPNVHYMRGLTYGYMARETSEAEDWTNAEDSFERYLEIDPHSPWARVDLSWVYFAQGKYEEMKPVLEEGLQEAPESPWLLNMYGLALLNTGHKTEAAQYFEKATNLAATLTVEDWGRAYPGNDPRSWSYGLEEMKRSIKRNLELANNE